MVVSTIVKTIESFFTGQKHDIFSIVIKLPTRAARLFSRDMLSSRIFNLFVITTVIGWFLFFSFWKFDAVRFVNEDGPVEWMQVFFLTISALYCLLIVKGYDVYYKTLTIKVCFAVFLLLLILVIGEEISWGQRIFDIQTPDFIKNINKQHEINIHNLKPLQRYRHWILISIGLIGIVAIFNSYIYRLFLDDSLRPALQPSVKFTLILVLILLAGLFVELGDQLEFYRDDSLNRKFRYLAGRTSEIAELFVAITAFYYSSSKYYEMKRGDWKLREFLSEHRTVQR